MLVLYGLENGKEHGMYCNGKSQGKEIEMQWKMETSDPCKDGV